MPLTFRDNARRDGARAEDGGTDCEAHSSAWEQGMLATWNVKD